MRWVVVYKKSNESQCVENFPSLRGAGQLGALGRVKAGNRRLHWADKREVERYRSGRCFPWRRRGSPMERVKGTLASIRKLSGLFEDEAIGEMEGKLQLHRSPLRTPDTPGFLGVLDGQENKLSSGIVGR